MSGLKSALQPNQWRAVAITAGGVVVAATLAFALHAGVPGGADGAGDVTEHQASDHAQQAQEQVHPQVAAPAPNPEPSAPRSPAEQRVPQDLRAKVASLMVVGVANEQQARAALDQGVGGLIIPSWADPALLTAEGHNIDALRAQYHHPFSVAIDFEGGRVQRHTDVMGEFMAPRELATRPPEVIQGTGYDIGRALRGRGVNVDYAPLLDLDVTELAIVGDRAFSGHPEEVVRVGSLFAQGLVDARVTPTFKHFPGHGRASGDTHHGLAVTPPLDQVRELDMRPFGPLLKRFPRASVMMGHMIVPGMGPEGVPSSLNPEAYRILREGDYPGGVPFEGVVVTDDLSGMRGILDYAPTPEAVKRAIAAGADQALWSSGADIRHVIDVVVGAVESGELPEARVDEAAARSQQQLINVGL